MLNLHITKMLLLFLLSYVLCRVDSWCKLVFNYGKPIVNMFYEMILYDDSSYNGSCCCY